MTVSIVLFDIIDILELHHLKQHLDDLSIEYEAIVACPEYTSDLKRLCADFGFKTCRTNETDIHQRQRTALAACQNEWVLFLRAGERIRSATADWTVQLNQAPHSAYLMEVHYRTDRLRAVTHQVRLLKRSAAASLSADALAVADWMSFEAALLSTHYEPIQHTARDRFLVADAHQHLHRPTESALIAALQSFAEQNYAQASERFAGLADQLSHTDDHLPLLRQSQFFQSLCLINTGDYQSAILLTQEVINDSDEYAIKDFCYHYAKMTASINEPEVKREAIDLLRECYMQYKEAASCFLELSNSDLLLIAGDLHMQLGETDQAKNLFFDAMVFSDYQQEQAAFRFVEALHLITERDDQLNDFPRLLLEEFNFEDPEAKRLLYAAFRHVGLDEWAALFYEYHESARFMRSSAKVSVILPVYNHSNYLRQSIESVLRQTYTNFELIIVDDGSEEPVQQIADEFWYDRRIHYHRLSANGGLPRALNTGLQLAKGTFLTWHSADNEMHETLLERLTAALASASNKPAAFANYQHIDQDGLMLEKIYLRPYDLNGLSNAGPAFMWRTEALRETGGFDPQLFGIEDRDFATRTRMLGTFAHVPENLYSYRIHPESLSAEIDNQRFGGWSQLHDKLQRKWLFWSYI